MTGHGEMSHWECGRSHCWSFPLAIAGCRVIMRGEEWTENSLPIATGFWQACRGEHKIELHFRFNNKHLNMLLHPSCRKHAHGGNNNTIKKQRWTTLTAADDFMSTNNTLALMWSLYSYSLGAPSKFHNLHSKSSCRTDKISGVKFPQAQQPMTKFVGWLHLY